MVKRHGLVMAAILCAGGTLQAGKGKKQQPTMRIKNAQSHAVTSAEENILSMKHKDELNGLTEQFTHKDLFAMAREAARGDNSKPLAAGGGFSPTKGQRDALLALSRLGMKAWIAG